MELDPEESSEPYHYTFGREQWVMVLTGSPTLGRTAGVDGLQPGDMVCLREGPHGAHCLLNQSAKPTRLALLSTTGVPANTYYPDSEEWWVRNTAGGDSVLLTAAKPDAEATSSLSR